MADNTQTNSTTTQTGAAVTTSDIVVDKNKSAEQYLKEAESKYIVSSLVRDKFPDLVKLIYETESMNVEEREYWLQIMPIMTEDQISKFRDILVNEKNELSKLDTEYQAEMQKLNQKKAPEIDPDALKNRIQSIKKAEATQQNAEQKQEEDLLNQLDSL
jgi:hypothetical protein